MCTDHEIHTCARSYATLGWISWKSMHFSWKDDSPLWILCVNWCQIERAARLRLQLGNLLHLHAIMSVKSPPVLVLYCYLNMPTINKTYLIQKHEMILTRQAWQQGIIIPWWQVSFFFLWQTALLEKPWLHLKWLHFRLTLIPLLISPKPLTI